MSTSAIISYLGENKPNLISEITSYLTDLGGEFSGVTFATLGRVCELTMVYHKLDKTEIKEIKLGLEQIDSAKGGEFQIKPLETFSDGGPTTKITHRVVLSGEDQKGLLNKIIKTLNQRMTGDHGGGPKESPPMPAAKAIMPIRIMPRRCLAILSER